MGIFSDLLFGTIGHANSAGIFSKIPVGVENAQSARQLGFERSSKEYRRMLYLVGCGVVKFVKNGHCRFYYTDAPLTYDDVWGRRKSVPRDYIIERVPVGILNSASPRTLGIASRSAEYSALLRLVELGKVRKSCGRYWRDLNDSI